MAKPYARCSRCRCENASDKKTCQKCRDALKKTRIKGILARAADRERAKQKGDA